MTDWHDPDVLPEEATAFSGVFAFCIGLYLWDIVQTLWFEWGLVSRKIPMRWSYVPYFVGRYAVITLFATLMSMGFGSIDNCSATFRFALAQVSFALAVAGASLNLTIRTVAIWRCNRYVTALLIGLSLFHWTTLFFFAVQFTQTSSTDNGSCDVNSGGDGSLTAVYVTTIVLDLLVFVLSIVGLARFAAPTTQGGSGDRLWRAVLKQGVGYFLLTLLLNVPSLVLASLNLNSRPFPYFRSQACHLVVHFLGMMEVMSSLPAMICSVMASCRAVSSLIRDPDTDGVQHDGPPDARTTSPRECLFTTHIDLPDPGGVETVQLSRNENLLVKRSPC
ncbi:hypothetical protein JAAARDRAFT_73331 [Jaapia argillacea MUCL 33604]|uniref:Uncharacterized protein n=1 Tax=Jaapia argillacea MUCL 33604 TaxID=933084 RepID=A0A067PA86_9AGAM|nr:hypothetical protein JAAARDRAFT_73331 [Jaapia argillacea MUCL 33604]